MDGSGMSECRCAGCGLRFTGVTAFDRHQRMLDVRPHVECRDPRDVGLVARVRSASGRRRTVWGSPPRGDVPWSAHSADSKSTT